MRWADRALLAGLCGSGVFVLAAALGVNVDVAASIGVVTALGVVIVLSARPHS